MQANFVSSERRALIVEDEILIAEELRERLSRLGFSVIGVVDTADKGVAIATNERPDLVLSKGRRTAYKLRPKYGDKLMCRSYT